MGCLPAPGRACHRQSSDAPEASCVSILKQHGALMLGKTVTTEFAYFEPGPTHNPHNLAHTPGGSSSGSAAGGGRRIMPVGDWYTDGRLGDSPGGILRDRWLQAQLWPYRPNRCDLLLALVRSCRPVYAGCGRDAAYRFGIVPGLAAR